MGVKLGQKWAVKDGNLLASNQVGSRFFNKEFDFSRASNGTYVDRDGLLKTAELYNLLSYSQDFSNAYWTKTNSTITSNSVVSPDGILNADKLIESTSASEKFIQRILSATTSTIYTASIFVKYGGREWIRFTDAQSSNRIHFNTLTGEFGSIVGTVIDYQSIALNNGWYRLSITTESVSAAYAMRITLAESDNDISYTGDGISGVYIFGAQLVEGTEPLDYQYTNGLQGLPRISFEDGVGHLLLEPQRSNLLLQSNSFDTTWLKTYTSVTGGQSGIYGSNDAWKLSEVAANSVHILVQNTSSVSSYTYSVYLKKGTRNKVLLFDGTNNVGVKFNLETQSFNSFYSATINYNIEVLSDEWARYSISPSNTSSSFRIYMLDDNYNLAYEGNTSNYIYVQHAQLESGSYPTSVIETTTTQITRLADVCNNSGSVQDFNSEEGVLYAEIAALADDNSDKRIMISDGTYSNYVTLGYSRFSGNIVSEIYSGGVLQTLNWGATGVNKLNNNKFALSWGGGTMKFYVNGTQTNTESITSPIGLNVLALNAIGNTLPFYGKVRNLQVFTEALGDTQLISLTGGDSSSDGLLASYISRVEAGGGTVEAQTCVKNELIELL